VYDQFGEEGLKGGGGGQGAPGGAGGFPGGGFGSFPGGTTTFSFSSGGPGGFSPTDPNRIFEQFFKMSGGGMPGFSMFGGGDDDDMGGRGSPFSTFGSFGGMPGGMPGSMPGGMPRQRQTSSSQPAGGTREEIFKPLKVSLEDLYTGTTKNLKVGRKLLSGGAEEKVLKIDILPGWKSGTKVRFAHAGNELPSGESQDLVFVVEEKDHPRFKRDGNDLVYTQKISLVDALVGVTDQKVVGALDGRKIRIPIPSGVVKPNLETRIIGEGMPIRKPGGKGDLVVKWEVEFPDRLTPSQKEGVRKILG